MKNILAKSYSFSYIRTYNIRPYIILNFTNLINLMNHTHQELDIFRTYLDINEIPHYEQWLELAHHILHQQHRQIITFHQWGFIFYYFDQFIKGEITLEQFMTMGDIE